MLKSMTGFGRFEIVLPKGKFILELQSVNRRGLELNFIGFANLPLSFEAECRRRVQSQIERGRLTLRLIQEQEAAAALLPSVSVLETLKIGWQERARALNLSDSLSLDLLIQWASKICKADAELFEGDNAEVLYPLIDGALERLLVMKRTEGAFLKRELEGYIRSISQDLEKVVDGAKTEQIRFQKDLLERFSGLFSPSELDRERVLKEAFFLLEKSDISEERARLASHLEQFLICLDSPKEAIGRKLDFLAQEMMREISTMGAKSMGVEVARLVVDIKSLIEKIREQIQNIE